MLYIINCTFCDKEITGMGSLKRPGKDGKWCSVECLIQSAQEEKQLKKVSHGKQ